MTVEELEAIEIDWAQGVGENFQRVKSDALAALEAANRRADEAEARMYINQRIAIAAEAEIDTLRARAAELDRLAAFFASCIKSGEPWSETCESMYAALKKGAGQ
jgi:RNA polymerase-binding transcription factor DksA